MVQGALVRHRSRHPGQRLWSPWELIGDSLSSMMPYLSHEVYDNSPPLPIGWVDPGQGQGGFFPSPMAAGLVAAGVQKAVNTVQDMVKGKQIKGIGRLHYGKWIRYGRKRKSFGKRRYGKKKVYKKRKRS